MAATNQRGSAPGQIRALEVFVRSGAQFCSTAHPAVQTSACHAYETLRMMEVEVPYAVARRMTMVWLNVLCLFDVCMAMSRQHV